MSSYEENDSHVTPAEEELKGPPANEPSVAAQVQSHQPPINTGTNRSFIVTLPSQGVLYGDKIPGGRFELRPMTTAEEAILFNTSGDGISKVNAVIDACAVTKDIPLEDLLLIDRFYILLVLRTRSFGAVYAFPTRCQGCQAQFKTEINISEDLEINPMSEDVVEPFDVTLPFNGDTVSLRFLRGKDEVRVARHAKRIRMQSTDPGDPSHTHRMALQIVAINGREVQLVEAQRYVESLDIGDSNAIRTRVEEVEGGVDTTCYVDCRMCGFVNEIDMPFTIEFFRPSARR